MAIINGTNLNNVIFGTGVADTINALDGDDFVSGAGGNDLVTGGIGNDILLGESGNDELIGNAGHDTILGGSGNDTITGDDASATGNDILDGGEGNDVINGGNGDDIIYSSAGTDYAQGGAGNDVYFVYADEDSGGFGNTNISDTGGIDTLNFSLWTNGITASLVEGGPISLGSTRQVILGVDEGGPAPANIENAIGTDFNDKIIGNTLANRIEGGAGNDNLFGLAGSDTLVAGAGEDRLGGGAVTRRQETSTFTNPGDAFQTMTVTADVGDDSSAPGFNQILTQGSSVQLRVAFDLFALVDSVSSQTNYVLRAGILDPGTFAFVPFNFVVLNRGSQDPVGSVTGGFTAIQGEGSQTQSETLVIAIVGLDPAQSDDIVVELSATNTRGNSGSSSRTNNILFQREDLGATVSGDDTLDGGAFGAGVSTLMGGDGNDTYILRDPNDLVQENADEGTDLVQSDQDYTLPFAVENLTLLEGGAAGIGVGNTLDNTITGNSGTNFLFGRGGNDTLIGGGGNDFIDGGTGNDAMTGGDGDDTFYVDQTGDTVSETALAGSGIDTVVSRLLNYTLAANVERGTLDGGEGGTAGVNLTGNILDNTLTGNSNNNALNGGLGNDTMIGGDGNDTYFVGQTGDAITESNLYGSGIDTVFSTVVSYTLATNVENLTLQTGAVTGIGNTLDNIITGNTVANTLSGGIGNDTLNGGAGGDAMDGGAGNDTYVVDNLLDTIVDVSGVDTVQTAIQLANPLYAPIENLTLTGSLAINGFGNGLNNRIVGNNLINTLDGGVGNDVLEGFGGNDILLGGVGNDLLNGGTGNDAMTGGAGNDIYMVDTLLDTVTEAAGGGTADRIDSTITYSLAALTEIEQLTLIGVSNINGTGNGLANRITGNSGINTLDGGLGVDILIGGLGNDVYKIDVLGESVSEVFDQGIDRVESFVNYSLGANVENLTLMGTANLTGTGNELANRIVGNDGANTLNGGLGVDTLIGGAGNDTYRVDAFGDTITEINTCGTDLVISTANSYVLGDFVEDLTLSGAAVGGFGNGLVNRITGTATDNTLDGRGGADTMTGGAGNDTYFVDDALDIVIDSAGTADRVTSTITRTLETTIENLRLLGVNAINGTGNGLGNEIEGNNQVNVLNGLGGNDVLIGRDGADTLTGGAGLDTFRFSVLEDLADTITDFSVADDQIEISASAFGGGLIAGNAVNIQFNTLTPIGTGGQFFYDDGTAELRYDQNGTDAGGLFLIAIVLGGQFNLVAADFVII
jgi:Ca2+-binding RTX toxin-like protein